MCHFHVVVVVDVIVALPVVARQRCSVRSRLDSSNTKLTIIAAVFIHTLVNCCCYYYTKLNFLKLKRVAYRALNETPSQSYGVSLAIWDHTVLPATQHK